MRKNITIPEELLERIKDYRHYKQFATEKEAILRLLEAGLEREAVS